MNAPFAAVDDEPLELGELPDSLGFVLRLAQIRTFGQFFSAFADEGVKPGEFTVVWVVGLNPGVKQGTLARALRIKPAHMTKLVQRLVSDDLLVRETPPEDRRSVRLTLTEGGRRFVARNRARFLDVHTPDKLGLSQSELDQLLFLLNKMTFKEGVPCP